MLLGIEIGGTKLQLGVGGGDGELVALERYPVDPAQKANGILQQIQQAGSRLIESHRVTRIGIGFGGPVDHLQGRVVTSHQIAGWDNFPLAEWCCNTLGQPVILGNDCDVAALAEAQFGAGKGRQIVFFLTVGTGIGGGLVVDGRLAGNSRPAIAEIGHLRPGLDCDRPDQTVESLASGPAIETAARSRVESPEADADVADLLERCRHRPEQLSAQIVAEAGREGNQIAISIFEQACRALGWAIAQVITLTAPEAIVVGGGVSLSGDELFFKPLQRFVGSYVFTPLADSYKILPAALGEEVVIHGALALAADDS